MNHQVVLTAPDPTSAVLPVIQRPPLSEWTICYKNVRVENHPPYRFIFLDGSDTEWVRYRVEDRAAERLTAYQLCSMTSLTQRDVARLFGYSESTVSLWCCTARRHGIAALHTVGIDIDEELKQELEERSQVEQTTVHQLSFLDQNRDDQEESTGDESPPVDIEGTSEGEVLDPHPDELQLGPPEEITYYSRYAGITLAFPFFHDMMDPVLEYAQEQMEEFGYSDTKTYTAPFLLSYIAFLSLAGVHCPEQVKSLHRQEFGILLGAASTPCCETVRRNLPLLAAADLPQFTAESVAHSLVEHGYVQLGLMYTDGHFVPYTGKADVAKGWWPQHQGVHKGFEQFWVNDQQGRPLLCELHQVFAYFPNIIPDLVKQVQQLASDHNIDQELIFCFDRGAYCGRLFGELDQLGIGWITLRKYAEQQDRSAFDNELTITDSTGRERHLLYCTGTTSIKDYRDDVQSVWYYDQAQDQQMQLITNLNIIYPHLWDAAFGLNVYVGRWKEENFFRHGGATFNIDNLMGHHFGDMEDLDYEVPNPEYIKLESRIQHLERLKEKAQDRVEGIYTGYESLKRKPSFERYLSQKGNQKKLQRFEAIQTELEECRLQIDKLSPKIQYHELHDKDQEIFLFEREQTIMTLKIVAFHLFYQLRDLAQKHFHDPRELNKLLQSLLYAGGSYKLQPNREYDIVRLIPPELPRMRKAAEAILDEINKLGPVIPLTGRRIRLTLLPDGYNRSIIR